MIRLLVALFWSLILVGQPALAAQVQVTGKDAAGTTRNFTVTTNTDITGNLVPNQVICDPITPSQCLAVSAAGAAKVDGSAVTQPITAAALPLPAGAATAAGVATVNTTLGSPFQAGGSIGNTTFAATQGTSPWVVSNSGTFATQSAITAASGALASGSLAAGSMVDFLTVRGTKAPGTAAANSALIGGVYTAAGVTLTDGQQAALQFTTAGSAHMTVDNTNANGQTTMMNSSPVVIASNQSSIPVTVASGGVASGGFASGSIASGAIAAGAQVDLLTMRGTVAAGTAASNSMLTGAVFNATAPTLTNGQQAAVQVSARGGTLYGSQYPAGSTPVTASATGTTGATTATLATGASVTTYICGFSIRANANAAATANSTVTGTITGTLNFTQWTAPNASGIGITEMIFNPCVPASAVNTGIAVISAAPGTGGVVSSTAWGYTL